MDLGSESDRGTRRNRQKAVSRVQKGEGETDGEMGGIGDGEMNSEKEGRKPKSEGRGKNR
jgi:hypothetical protein